jgi:hypothetical protein
MVQECGSHRHGAIGSFLWATDSERETLDMRSGSREDGVDSSVYSDG